LQRARDPDPSGQGPAAEAELQKIVDYIFYSAENICR
jgi:hypothetical protein